MSTSMIKVDVVFLDRLCEFLLNGEPVFIFRAQDGLLMEILQEYLERAMRSRASNTSRIRSAMAKISKWQHENLDRVKVPD